MDHYWDENSYLLSLTPAYRIIQAGHALELNENTAVLDLCCGYGEMLRIWAQHFGVSGIGVDRCAEFVETGTIRFRNSGLDGKVTLILSDILDYSTDRKFDVACMCGVGDIFGGIEGQIKLLETYLRPGGKLVVAQGFRKAASVPQELIDFEGTLYTLEELWDIFKRQGWYISHFSTSTHEDWERYISWEAKRTIERIKKAPGDTQSKAWYEKWYHMYFSYRREYEGVGYFVLERL